ncbi:MAG: AMP-binding protein, partial [Deltaproteobacteria bacterium]|nr:AMP-binding protein [Deltaproteobacteria bacterium]
MNSFHVPERFNAADYFIDENIRQGRSQKVAIYSAEKNYTYDEVYQSVNRCGNLLKTLGVEMENRVLLLLQDSPEFIISFFGAIKIGAIPIPTNTMLKAPDFEYVLNDSRAKVLIIDQNFLPEIEKIKGNLKYLKTLLVVGKEAGNDLLFSNLLKESSPELDPAETKKDDAAFWLYSARKPDELMGAIHLQKNMAYCTEYYARTI